jgi:hypothetical protein
VIGSEEVPGAWLDVASQRAALCLRDRREHRPERRSLRAQHREIRGRAEDVQAVDVDVCRKLLDWHHRMPREVLRAEQPRLLERRRDEVEPIARAWFRPARTPARWSGCPPTPLALSTAPLKIRSAFGGSSGFGSLMPKWS